MHERAEGPLLSPFLELAAVNPQNLLCASSAPHPILIFLQEERTPHPTWVSSTQGAQATQPRSHSTKPAELKVQAGLCWVSKLRCLCLSSPPSH